MKRITVAQKLCIILLLVLLIGQKSFAQEGNPVRRGWLTLNCWIPPFPIGLSNVGLAADISLHYQVNAHLFSLRGLWTGGFSFDEYTESRWDISMLYGRSTVSDVFHASIAGGIGLTGGHRNDPHSIGKIDIPTTIGAAFQAQSFWTFSSFGTGFLGIGPYVFANVNPQTQFYGTTLNLQFGILED